MNYSSAKATLGYGLTLMLVFVASTVMLGSSLQMMAGPISMAYLGTASQENLAARELANAGMDAVIADLQSKYDNGQSITTSYSYASSSAPSSVLMPSNPNAPGTLDATVGTYTGAISAINGNNMLVSVTATVGSGVYQFNKLLSLSRNPTSLDNVTGATAAYGMRKLRSAYAGSAIRVRRGSDNVEQDIGFNASGALDVAALRNFLENSTTYPKPLDAVGSAVAAYSTRKLSNSYTGYAIRVRRSSDNTTLDIGFDLAGNLDINALTDFVGANSAYVVTWYDQSGNARDTTQATTAGQPRIVNAGVLDTLNNRPAVRGLGGQVLVGTSSAIMAGTGGWHYLTVIGDYGTTSGNNYIDRNSTVTINPLAGLQNLGGKFVMQKRTDAGTGLATITSNTTMPTDGTPVIISYQRDRTNSFYKIYYNGSIGSIAADTDTDTTPVGPAILGHGSFGSNRANAAMGELIIYTNTLSTANRQILENDQARYYQVKMTEPDYPYPLDPVAGNTTAAYGLRKLLTTTSGSYAINVRRSSDSTTKQIGYDSKNNLDVATLMNFCGTGSCYIDTWYDQKGNKDATQATAANQPRIVNTGVLDMINGKPTIVFSGSQWLSLASVPNNMGFNYASTLNLVAYSSTQGATLYHQGNGSTWASGYSTFYFNNGAASTAFGKVQSSGDWTWGAFGSTDGTPHVFTLIDPMGASNQTVSTNGVITTNHVATVEVVAAGTVARIGWSPLNDNSVLMNGGISELAVMNTNLSTVNRQNLENNQMAYYNVNSAAPGSGFVTKWYDQSGNGYDFSQSTKLSQPKIVWDNITNRPAIYYNGTSNYMTTGTTLSFTGTQATAFAVANMASTSLNKARLFSATVTTPQNDDAGTAGAAIFFCQNNGASQLMGYRVGAPKGVGSISTNKTIQATSIFDGTNQTIRINRIAGTSVASSGNFNIVQLWTGASPYSASTDWWSGTISELILYPSNPTATQIQNIEEDQRSFYGTP